MFFSIFFSVSWFGHRVTLLILELVIKSIACELFDEGLRLRELAHRTHCALNIFKKSISFNVASSGSSRVEALKQRGNRTSREFAGRISSS